ncbi:MAG TPA: hypothetical protein VF181_05115 [Balneolaceae bacterium]
MTKDELIYRYLNGELDADKERKVLHMIADDEDLRSMLHFEYKLNSVFLGESAWENSSVPEGFSEGVMNLIAQKEEKAVRESTVWNWLKKLWAPQPLQWRPVYAVATVLLIIGFLSYSPFKKQDKAQFLQIANLENSVQQVSSTATEVMLRFIYFDEKAESVAVAGDFSNWEPIELSKQVVNGKKIWTGLVTMSRGEHNYMFVRNGSEWVTDPLAMVHRSDGFGNKNAVIYL